MLNIHYINRYKRFIAYCRIRKLKVKYSETHHVKPKCLGGSNDEQNLIELSAREHYIAHWILSKCYTKGIFKQKLAYAFSAMAMKRSKNAPKFTAKQFERVKLALSKVPGHWRGKKHTEATKQKIREANLGKTIPAKTRKKISKSVSASLTGKTRSAETRAKISKTLTGKAYPIERRASLQPDYAMQMHIWSNGSMQIYCSAFQLALAFNLDLRRVKEIPINKRKSHKQWRILHNALNIS